MMYILYIYSVYIVYYSYYNLFIYEVNLYMGNKRGGEHRDSYYNHRQPGYRSNWGETQLPLPSLTSPLLPSLEKWAHPI